MRRQAKRDCWIRRTKWIARWKWYIKNFVAATPLERLLKDETSQKYICRALRYTVLNIFINYNYSKVKFPSVQLCVLIRVWKQDLRSLFLCAFNYSPTLIPILPHLWAREASGGGIVGQCWDEDLRISSLATGFPVVRQILPGLTPSSPTTRSLATLISQESGMVTWITVL